MEKVVQLQRRKEKGENPGSFGFSVAGGAGRRLPAVVFEIVPGGPADQSGKVRAVCTPVCGEACMPLFKIGDLVFPLCPVDCEILEICCILLCCEVSIVAG